jgi:hypothetical protein
MSMNNLIIRTDRESEGSDFRLEALVGRKRIEESEKMETNTINLKKKIMDEIKLKGNPKAIIENLVADKYDPTKI